MPNGRWPADEEAIPLFNRLTAAHDVTVVYVTGRNLALTEEAILQYGIRHPDFLCADVGASLYRRSNDQWQFDEGWAKRIQLGNPSWNTSAIQASLAGIAGLRAQAAEHQGRFKQSYFVDLERSDSVLESVRQKLAGQFDEVLIYSIDSAAGRGLLDCMPRDANKRSVLEYLCDELAVPRAELVFCGDSGNDILPLSGEFCGVLVRNADSQLRDQLLSEKRSDLPPRIYLAQGGFRNLNGYYCSGVIEGCYHYDLFTD